VKVQRLTSSEASVTTGCSSSSGIGDTSNPSDDGASVVMVPSRANDTAHASGGSDVGGGSGYPSAPLSGRLFKRSSVLGRVTWTLQLMNLNGTTLSYTNKDGKDKSYEIVGCTVCTPQVQATRRQPLRAF
jgi:hypothetical protein